MLIDKTYFTGDIFIANLNEACDNLGFYEWIERWEEQCLRTTLGDCLYEDFILQLLWDENLQKYVLKQDAEEKWDWLLNGHNYTRDEISTTSFTSFNWHNCKCGCNNDNCDSFKWDGLRVEINRRIKNTKVGGVVAQGVTIKKSYIAYYIYWLWSLKSDSVTTSLGEKVLNAKNAMNVSNIQDRIDAHNKFVSMVTGCDSSGNVGLYKYVRDFNNLYPTWGGKCLKHEPIW